MNLSQRNGVDERVCAFKGKGDEISCVAPYKARFIGFKHANTTFKDILLKYTFSSITIKKKGAPDLICTESTRSHKVSKNVLKGFINVIQGLSYTVPLKKKEQGVAVAVWKM